MLISGTSYSMGGLSLTGGGTGGAAYQIKHVHAGNHCQAVRTWCLHLYHTGLGQSLNRIKL